MLSLLLSAMAVSSMAREKTCVNTNWKFIRECVAGAEATGYNDSKWKTVNLPHDAQVDHEFQKEGDGASACNGYLPLGKGWYRKHIAYDKSWDGQRVILEFEGVYRDAKVYLNGKKVSQEQPNGYIDFEIDITDDLNKGDNVIAVNYDNSYPKSSRWYNGEGIFRDVNIHTVNPLHVDRYGTYVTTPKISSDKAKVCVATDIRNDRKDSVLCRLETEILDPQGKGVAHRTAIAPFAAGETYTFQQEMQVGSPQLWGPGKGILYKVVSKVYLGNELCDTYETPFGIREIEFTPEQGLLVNGERVYINGVCLHHDLGPLGAAAFKKGWDKRLDAVVNTLGCNGIRLSHNCYPKYVLEWADKHGILVFDEFFDKWDDSYYGQGAKLGEYHYRDMVVQMRRDRNHPSVFVWSVGNEVYYQIQKEKTQSSGVQKLKKLVNIVRATDPSRKVTVGQYPNRYGSVTKKKNPKKFEQAEPHQFEFYTDIVTTNYLEKFWDRDHAKYPQLIFMESEMAVGDLGYDYFNFDHSYPVGSFYWGGTDYIGESFGWPFKGWTRGLLGLSNRLKPLGQSVKSFYTSAPMTKIITIPQNGSGGLVWNDLKMTWLPLTEHWNYNDGDTLTVQVMSNCDETELWLNGESLGKKKLPAKNKAPQLQWTVPYKAGELKTVGYNNGVKVAEDIVRTAGAPAKITVESYDKEMQAGTQDLAYINVLVTDKDGNPCADNTRVNFKVDGEATIAGVCSDDIASDDPFNGDSHTIFNGRCQLIIRSTLKPGKVKVTASAKGAGKTTVTVNSL